MIASYSEWAYFPFNSRPPDWVTRFVTVVAEVRSSIDSGEVDGLTSDKVLEFLRPGLEDLGYQVESGKQKHQKIRRPVLFGERGVERVSYEVDAVHDREGIVVEVEAGRGARGNASYRDLIRTSLIVGADYLALRVMSTYRHNASGKPVVVHSYNEVKDQLEAIYASGRLSLPFKGVLLFG